MVCYVQFILYYCPARVDYHDTKAKNTGNQLLFGNQLLLLGDQLYTQEKSGNEVLFGIQLYGNQLLLDSIWIK